MSDPDGDRVIVQVRVPRGAPPGDAREAFRSGVPDFDLDEGYAPVPLTPHPDDARGLEAAGEQVVLVRGRVAPDGRAALEAHPDVLRVEGDAKLQMFKAPTPGSGTLDDALPAGEWSYACPAGAVGDGSVVIQSLFPSGRQGAWTGQGVSVAVVDTGISAQCKNGVIPKVVGGWPAASWGTAPAMGPGAHGSMCAYDLQIVAPLVDVYDANMGGLGQWVSVAIAALNYVLGLKSANPQMKLVVTNSWGIYNPDASWDDAIESIYYYAALVMKVRELVAAGIFVLFAAGNCGGKCGPAPQCGTSIGLANSIWGANGALEVMTVGAATVKDELLGYSSFGPAALDPGKPDFLSCSHFKGYPNYTADTGTSAATPIAAGVVALMLQTNPGLTPQQAKWALMNSGSKPAQVSQQWEPYGGRGMINANRALETVDPRHVTVPVLGVSSGEVQLMRLRSRSQPAGVVLDHAVRTTSGFYSDFTMPGGPSGEPAKIACAKGASALSDPIGPGSVLHAFVTDARSSSIWHRVRRRDTTWTPGEWQDVASTAHYRGVHPHGLACASAGERTTLTDVEYGEVHLVVVDDNGEIWHSLYKPPPWMTVPPTWTPFGDVKSQAGPCGRAIDVACATDATNQLHLFALIDDSVLYTLRRPSDGSWLPWVDVRAKTGFQARGITSVSCASGISDQVQLVLSTKPSPAEYIGLWHTLYTPPDSWGRFGDVLKQLDPSSTREVQEVIDTSAGEGPAGELHLAFQFVPSQKPPLQPTWIGSTIRNPQGSWQQQLEIQPTLMLTSFATAVSRYPGTYNVVTARGTAPVEFVRRPTDGPVE